MASEQAEAMQETFYCMVRESGGFALIGTLTVYGLGIRSVELCSAQQISHHQFCVVKACSRNLLRQQRD
jgi:hypothetical protein